MRHASWYLAQFIRLCRLNAHKICDAGSCEQFSVLTDCSLVFYHIVSCGEPVYQNETSTNSQFP